jgi:glycine cleavage system H protein
LPDLFSTAPPARPGWGKKAEEKETNMDNPEDLYYSREHVWVRMTGNRAAIGITDHAQQEMGEILFAELPDEGTQVEQNDSIGTLESSKTVAEIYAPVSGEVISVNKDLEEEPALVNDDPYGNGWLLAIDIDDPKELEDLLKASEYDEFLEKGEGEKAK